VRGLELAKLTSDERELEINMVPMFSQEYLLLHIHDSRTLNSPQNRSV
jgi:hypothetical protein